MTEAEAIAYVMKKAQTEEFPVVPPDDVEEIVRLNMRARVWQPETAYKIGDKVQPLKVNGHFYKCVAAGTSGITAPTWNVRENSRTSDGDALVWLECETDFDGSVYDTRTAIHELWLFKAGMASSQFDISIDQQKWNRSQIYDHCMEMARSFAPVE